MDTLGADTSSLSSFRPEHYLVVQGEKGGSSEDLTGGSIDAPALFCELVKLSGLLFPASSIV